jgi:hypothetical protein
MLSSLFVFVVGVSPPITEQNWKDHPAIKEAKSTLADVEQLKETERLRRKKRTFDNCTEYKDDLTRTLYNDPSGTPRL